ncbi:Transcription initiation factor IIA subunit 1 [Caligus rogercresseyi]|uniref:Transcription initiation factor IIA subunit 1 n=1 Tax=Caligus rogercresseyi TaxID=217165 RepID=A0A7T8GP83_CALRO|nr:Transcription initiation factor IIA subunit 1 [Caligus rogercresseyi]
MSERNVTSAANLYHSVIADIVTAVREPFLDEGVDENVLQELKTLWSNKLDASKTIEPPQPPRPQHLDPQNPERGSIESKLAASRNSGALRPASVLAAEPLGNSSSSRTLIVSSPCKSRSLPNQGIPTLFHAPSLSTFRHMPSTNGPTSAMLQRVLTQAITKALTLPEAHSASSYKTKSTLHSN